MMLRCYVAAAAVLLTFLNGCGGGVVPASGESAPVSIPTGLLLEMTISGTIQGLPLKSPGLLTVNDHGSVYLLDASNQRVIWFNRDMVSLRDFNGRGDFATSFKDPQGLAVDADHNVWISDYGHRRLVRTSDRLELTAELEFYNDSTNVGLSRPGSMAVTNFGDLWVVDLDNERVAVLNQLGELIQTVGDFGNTGGKLEEPSKILLDSKGHIWVCDRGNDRIVVYDDDGGLVREIKDLLLDEPTALAFGPGQSIWILEERTGKIHCFGQDGSLRATVGPVVAGADQPLSNPSDLVFLPDGRMVISDTGHDRVLVCRLSYAPLADSL
jgi:sugar lactone lactonase YvrE